LIILSWNTKDYLLGCLKSIEETAKGLSYEVIVVDNASSDGSADAARSAGFSNVRVIETGSNLGFAKGNNVGIHAATGRYLAILNSDIVVKPGCLQTLLTFMEKSPDIGMVGPRLLNSDGTTQANCRLEPTLWTHLGRALFINTSLAHPACLGGYTADVEVLAGAFWFVRREAVDKVGTLDEHFFFYGEDVDWCLRFKNHSWRITYLPQAESVHFGGVSSGLDSNRFSIELLKARLQLWEKYHGNASTLLYLCIALIHDATRSLTLRLHAIVAKTPLTRSNTTNDRHSHAIHWHWARLKEHLSRRTAVPHVD
jgi:GT2 family glycosyltransferase